MAVKVGAKPQKYGFSERLMTKDNQLAVCTPTIKYQSAVKMDEWFNLNVKGALSRMLEDYAQETYLYDVTTDRNMPKDLLKSFNEHIKTALKGPTKPTPTIKIEDVSLVIKRDR